MAKISGITSTISVGGQLISNDVVTITLNTAVGVQDITAIDNVAMARLALRADATGNISGIFNVAANMSHAMLKTPGSKATIIAYASAAATATFTAIYTNYNTSMAADGSLTWSADFELSSGTAVAWT